MAKNKSTPGPRPRRRKPSKRTAGKVGAGVKPGVAKSPIDPAAVRLVAGRGSAGRGGGSGGHYWHIYVGDARAGHVYINVIDGKPFGEHASVQIQVNKAMHGRGVGRAAYRLACESGGHDVVVAHMRKGNLASQKAAAAAGFTVVDDPTITQLAMRWVRPPRETPPA